MDGRALLEVLSDYNYWGSFNKTLFEREDYQTLLGNNLNASIICIVKGVRRAGKSSIILRYVAEGGNGKRVLVLNLEDPRLPQELDSKFLMDALDAYSVAIDPKGPALVVIDEAQHAKGWEKFARYLVETKGIKCIVTGSSAGLLSEEYATAITGRHIDMEVFPLSFSEFVSFRGIKAEGEFDMIKNRHTIKRAFEEYMTYGGFPEVVINEDKRVKVELLRNYFNDILIKDIAKRYNIKLQRQLEAISKDYLSNMASRLSLRNISKSYKIGLHTAERFSQYLSNAYLFFYVGRFNFSRKMQGRSIKKVYAIDNGFYSVLGFKFMEQRDKLMENLVAIRLLDETSRKHDAEIYYWQDYRQHEVDFVVKKGDSIKELIQVTYASEKSELRERETKSLIAASNELRCNNLLVITWDYEGETKEAGKRIRLIPLWKWLLSEEGKATI
jgi:hypothetical protein